MMAENNPSKAKTTLSLTSEVNEPVVNNDQLNVGFSDTSYQKTTSDARP